MKDLGSRKFPRRLLPKELVWKMMKRKNRSGSIGSSSRIWKIQILSSPTIGGNVIEIFFRRH